MRSRENVVKKSQVPEDIRVPEGQTLTYGQLLEAISRNESTTLSLGVGTYKGFDSCMFLHRAVVVDGELYLLVSSSMPYHCFKRDAELINLRTANKSVELYEPKAADLVALNLSPEAPVWIGVKKNFSWKGEMIKIHIETAGAHCFVSAGYNKDEDYEVYLQVGELSLWGEQACKKKVEKQE